MFLSENFPVGKGKYKYLRAIDKKNKGVMQARKESKETISQWRKAAIQVSHR